MGSGKDMDIYAYIWFLIPASMDIEYCQHPLQVLTIYWRIVFPLSPASIEKIGGFVPETDETT